MSTATKKKTQDTAAQAEAEILAAEMAETQAVLVDRVKAGGFYLQVGSGEPGKREVQVYAKGLQGNAMLVGVPESVLVAWIILGDPVAEGFAAPLTPERARRPFEHQAHGLKRLYQEAETELTNEERKGRQSVPMPDLRSDPLMPGETAPAPDEKPEDEKPEEQEKPEDEKPEDEKPAGETTTKPATGGQRTSGGRK